MYKYLIALFLVSCAASRSADKNREDAQLISHLQKHVHFLADDKLEGRRTGTEGELKAAEYISNEFRQIGLEPKGVGGFYQPFSINDGKEIGAGTSAAIENRTLAVNTDFFPMSYSAAATLHALPSIALQESDMPWFFDLKDAITENKNNPHFDLSSFVHEKATAAQKKGATALIVYNTSAAEDGLKFDGSSKLPQLTIPVVYVRSDVAKQFFSDRSAMLDIKLKTDWAEKTRTGRNVIGYINNNEPTTVVIGAHFDHLGYGEDKNSRYTGTDLQIHNGADDNASGTAALIEMARLLKSSTLKNNNYLFIAFSGEELGLYGSKYFTQNATIPLNRVNYMINMDMVGRLNDSSNVVTVGGYGTSPLWGSLYSNTSKLHNAGLQFRFDSSGTGPSDHTSFYLKDIPVLFYFTGLHTDYHKPTDDADKINYRGQAHIVRHIYSLIDNVNTTTTKLAFTKTREAQTTTSARFSVSLGIMPDYTFNGGGVRVDGVSDNKPAQKAGIKAGDIITALGDNDITSVESYMQVLSKFKKGDQTTVFYKRGSESLSASVEF